MPSCKMEITKGAQRLTARDMKTISSYMCSVRYLRKMVPLAVYNIIYNRIKFEESLFVDHTVCEIPFKMFKSGTKDHILADIFFCCKGVVEAIEKEYLSEMHLLFHDQRSNAILEDYKFSFTYDKEPGPVSLPKSEDVISITKQLFESIQALAKYGKLSDTIDISVELLFHDETPETYNPPNFTQPYELPLILRLPRREAYTTIGYLKTGYHKLKCAVNESAFGEETLDTSIMILEDDSTRVVIGGQTDDTRSNAIVNEMTDQNLLNNINEEACSITDIRSVTTPSSDTGDSFHCACGIDSPVEQLESVKCTICSKYQHLFCVGYTNADSMVLTYVCIYCGAAQKDCSDKILADTNPNFWQEVSCLRAFLYFSYKYKKPPLELLEKYDSKIKHNLLKLLGNKIMKINLKKNSVTLNEDLAIDLLTKLFFDFRLPQSMDLDENTVNF